MENLESLNKYNSKGFKIWINTRLKEQYSDDPERRYRACNFRSLGVPFGESHIDQLQMLFRRLSPKAKQAFRDGVTLLSTTGIGLSFDEKEDLYVLSQIIK